MSTVTGTIRVRATVEAGSTPVVYNVTAILANTEYSQAFSTKTKSFLIRTRNGSKLKVAFISGQSGTNYISVPRWSSLSCSELEFSDSIYFQSDTAGTVVEILEWS